MTVLTCFTFLVSAAEAGAFAGLEDTNWFDGFASFALHFEPLELCLAFEETEILAVLDRLQEDRWVAYIFQLILPVFHLISNKK